MCNESIERQFLPLTTGITNDTKDFVSHIPITTHGASFHKTLTYICISYTFDTLMTQVVEMYPPGS